jgi:hypothetical protein
MSRSLDSARLHPDPDAEAHDLLAKGVRTTWLVLCTLRADYADDPAALAVLTRVADVLPNIPATEEATHA